MRYLVIQWMDFDQNMHKYIAGRSGRVDQILVTLTQFSRSLWHFEMSKVGFFALSYEPVD